MSEYLKQEFSRHLKSIGFEFEASPHVIMQKLRERMGEKRFTEFQGRPRSHSAHSQEEGYTQFTDIVEGNLLRSLDKTATLDSSFALYEKCARLLRPGTRVMELGCWTGGLASFIAARHPECQVVGVDFAGKIIDACNAHYKLPNLQFREWNYRMGKPESLEPADILLCSMGVVHHMPDNTATPDPAAPRRYKDYLLQRDHAIGYFSLWRSAVRDGGTMLAVLRIGSFARFLGWMDAAQKTGWTPRLDALWHVQLPSDKYSLPGLVFEATPCGPLPEDALIERHTWFTQEKHLFAKLDGGAALATFRGWQNRTVLGSRTFRKDGLLMRDEVGWAGATGYVFTCDAIANYRLLLLSHDSAQQLATTISAKDFVTPINDDGTTQPSPPASAKAPPLSARIENPFFSGGAIFAGSPLPISGDGDRI